MASSAHLTRRGEVFWFRIRISRDPTAIIGRKEVAILQMARMTGLGFDAQPSAPDLEPITGGA